MQDCIFCKIVSGEIPSEKIFEDDGTFAFLDIRPVAKGHALVVPKKHSNDLLEADDEDLKQVMKTVKYIAAAVLKATGAAGFNTNINTGPVAGQAVFHTHIHIIPRFTGDGKTMWPHLEVKPETRAEMAAEIKKFIS